MRAEEMTVGLELCNLENLRIFNGYEVSKKDIKLSNPSSPEDSACGRDGEDPPRSKTKGQHSPRQCGRPANPIPRHKRDSHIRAEYKRRDKIQKGFETLHSLVPELGNVTSSKESKSSMLFKTAEYCRGIKADCGQSQNEAAALRQELETLGSEIHKLQEQLPEHGVKDTPEPVQDLDSLYDEYVKKETNKNWKFWIFSFFIRPLYKSYRSVISGKMNQFEFAQATNEWVTESLSLTNLRKGFLDSFRKFSTQTSVLINPGKLEEEAYAAVNNLVKTETPFTKQSLPSPQQEVPSKPTRSIPCSSGSGLYATVMTPRSLMMPSAPPVTVVEKSKECMSPPITTEVPRSGRSRSSTPPQVVKQRRRSRSRSEMNRTKIVEQSQPMDVSDEQSSITPSNPAVTPGHSVTIATGGRILQMMLSGDTMSDTSDRRYIVAGSLDSCTTTSTGSLELDNLVNSSSVSSPVVSPQPWIYGSSSTQPDLIASSGPSPAVSSQPWIHGSTSTQPDLITSSEPVSIFTTSYNSCHSSTFLPINSSVSISNGQVTPYSQPLDQMENQSILSDIAFAMDTTLSQPSEAYDLDNLSVYTTAQPTVISHHSPLSASHSTFLSPADAAKPVKHDIYQPDEDSLTGMLNIDLMDVGSLMTFLDQDPIPVVSTSNEHAAS